MSRTRVASRRRALIGGAALAGAATLTLATLTMAGSAAAFDDAPTITSEDGVLILQLEGIADEESFRYIPYGGEPSTEFPEDDADFRPGDAFTFGEDLVQGEISVGSGAITCTSAGVDEDNVCSVTMTFTDGTISAIGVDTGGDEATAFDLDIVGGTGTYDDAEGTMTVDPAEESGPDGFRLAFTAPAFDPAE